MDNSTRRTILRKVNTSSIQTVNEQVANLASFTGLNDSANYATVDQNSFSDTKNVYVDADNELTTRPPVKFGKLFEGMPSGDIEAVYTSNGTVFYLMNHALYFRWGGVLHNVGELYEETTDDDGNTVLNYYTQFKITWINDMFVIFERYIDEDEEKHTSLFGLQFKNGEWERYNYMQILYIPKKDYLSGEELESRNLFVNGMYIDYVFDGIAENEAAVGRALGNENVEIEVRGETFELVWDIQYSNVLIADVCDTLVNIEFDSYEQSANGYVILLYNKEDVSRKAWLSVNGGYGWVDITLGGGTLESDADFTLCLSEDGGAIFMFLHEDIEYEEAKLDPHGFGVTGFFAVKAYDCYVNLHVGIIDSTSAGISWTTSKVNILNNSTPFTSMHVVDISPDDNSNINGFTDDNLFSVDCLWNIGTNKDRDKMFSFVEMLDILYFNSSRYVKMHSPDMYHCALLLPVYTKESIGVGDVSSEARESLQEGVAEVSYGLYCQMPLEYYDLNLMDTTSGNQGTDDNGSDVLYPSSVLFHGPLYMNSVPTYVDALMPNIFLSQTRREYTDLIIYSSGTVTHSIGLSDNNADDATNYKNGKIRYIATNSSYDMILSFNGNSGGSYTMVPHNDVTPPDSFKSGMFFASDSDFTGKDAKTKSIDLEFDVNCYVPAYTALGHRTSFKEREGGIGSMLNTLTDLYTTDYRIFKNITNQSPNESRPLEQDRINELFASNTDTSAAITKGDNFAILNSLVEEQEGDGIDGLACEMFNVYANKNGIFANVAVMQDLNFVDYMGDIDCVATHSLRLPFLKNQVVANTGDIIIPSETHSSTGSHQASNMYLTGNANYNMNAYLPLHVFANLEKTAKADIFKKVENDYDKRIAFAHMYYEFKTITENTDSVQSFELDDYTDVEYVVVDKNITALMFVTEDFLYYNQYTIPFFWASEDFSFVPLSIMSGSKYFVGIDMETTRIWSSDYSYNGTTFTVTRMEITSINIEFPDFDSFLYSSTSLVFGNVIYQTQISAADNFDVNGYKKLYIPENTRVTLPEPVTNVTNFSQTVTGIFTEHTAFEYTFDEEYGSYRLFPTKLTIGSREGYDVVPALSADSIFISTVFGFRQLGYESFVQSTEQQLSIADDAINTVFKDFDTSPIKAQVFSYWIILYKTDDTTVLVLDARTGAWWKWVLPFAPELMYMIDDELYLYKDKSIYTLDFNADSCYDMNGEPIDWYFVSQKLHFSAPTYYKHINQLSIISTPKTDTMRYALELYNYHNGYSEKEDTVVKYDVDTVANCIKRFNFMKSNAFQFKISSDDSDKYPAKFRTSCISIKYRVTEKVR